MQDIKDLSLEELSKILQAQDFTAFAARQIFTWVYQKRVYDFSKMSDLSMTLRKYLKENFYVWGLELREKLRASDGTTKFLLELKDKNSLECVIIPTKTRLTGCISTQVGCKFACRFCASGLLGFKRNLKVGEIIEQVLYLEDSVNRGLNNLVFMGIGEPLDNYDNVLKSIRIINAPWGFNIGARKITISTCGIIPGIKRLMNEGLQIELSVSLHAADDKTRNKLMPINKKYPLPELMQTIRGYIKRTNRQVTFEYILIDKVNSDISHAKDLSKLLKGINCKVNLIPCNPTDGKVSAPGKLAILLFKNQLLKSGINTTLRMPRGRDIEAACGQLRLHCQKITLSPEDDRLKT